jgi:hypothetical protein
MSFERVTMPLAFAGFASSLGNPQSGAVGHRYAADFADSDSGGDYTSHNITASRNDVTGSRSGMNSCAK